MPDHPLASSRAPVYAGRMASVVPGQENSTLQQDGAQPTRELPLAPVPQNRITSHSNLERDIHMRYWAEQALLGRTLTRVGGDILVEPPIELDDPKTSPPWSGALRRRARPGGVRPGRPVTPRRVAAVRRPRPAAGSRRNSGGGV